MTAPVDTARLAAELAALDLAAWRPGEPADAVDGHVPAFVARPADEAQVAAVVKAAGRAGAALVPRGAGTRLHVGNPPDRLDLVLDLAALDAVVDHAVEDLTLTVQAGCRLGALDGRLAIAGQRLPLETPGGGAFATVGGIVASGASGPSRLRFGAPRDLVIGLRAVGADGEVFKAGGRVVKNVAGYDLRRLLSGSFGTLGVITELTFRIHPRPEAASVLGAAYPDLEALEAARGRFLADGSPWTALDAAGGEGVAALALPPGPTLVVAVEGPVEDVEALKGRALRLLAPDAAATAELVPEGALAVLLDAADRPDAALTLRVAVRPDRLVPWLARAEALVTGLGLTPAWIARAGLGLAFLHVLGPVDGPGPAMEGLLSLASRLAELGRDERAQVVLERAPLPIKRALDVWGVRPAGAGPTGEGRLRAALKAQFDPAGVLAPGRMG